MAGIKAALVTLAFAGSIGMTFVILGCALPEYKVWWPFFVVLFYVLAPIPTLVARRYTENSGSNSSPCLEAAVFITMGIVVSSFALPIVLARSPVNDPVDCTKPSAMLRCTLFPVLLNKNYKLMRTPAGYLQQICSSKSPWQVLVRRLARIQWGACYLTLVGNVIVYLTLVGFFITFDQDDSDYSTQW